MGPQLTLKMTGRTRQSTFHASEFAICDRCNRLPRSPTSTVSHSTALYYRTVVCIPVIERMAISCRRICDGESEGFSAVSAGLMGTVLIPCVPLWRPMTRPTHLGLLLENSTHTLGLVQRQDPAHLALLPRPCDTSAAGPGDKRKKRVLHVLLAFAIFLRRLLVG